MEIKQNLVPESKYPLKCTYLMEPTGICVHNTANDASAKNEISYMVGNTLQTSFHLAVDDVEVWQGLPLNRNGWHAGDGATGQGNRKHIGIEICYSKSGGEKFDKAENNAAKLIAQLLQERGWSISQVKKHQDFSGKYCPHRTLDLGWDRFINKIKENMPTDLYKGLDLNNKDSMRVAVDVWYAVVKENKYLTKEESEKLLNDLKAEYEGKLTTANNTAKRLADNLSAIALLLGLPADTHPDSILRAVKDLMDASNQPVPPVSSPTEQLPVLIEGNGKKLELSEIIYKVKN